MEKSGTVYGWCSQIFGGKGFVKTKGIKVQDLVGYDKGYIWLQLINGKGRRLLWFWD